MNEKQYEALLRIPGLKAARDLIVRELEQALAEASGADEPVEITSEGRLSETGRARISAGQKRRWARIKAERGDAPGPAPSRPKSEAWTPEKRAAQSALVRRKIQERKSSNESSSTEGGGT